MIELKQKVILSTKANQNIKEISRPGENNLKGH